METDRDNRSTAPDGGTPSFAALLRAHREGALLSQEELAARSGLSVRAIRDVEAGRVQRPRGESLRLLADALELTDGERSALTGGRAAASTHAVARQLPADVVGFTGRSDVLRALDDLLPRDGALTADAVVITAIAGTAGVGKTALAVHWAHRVAGCFPDGQLFVDLNGYGLDRPLAPIRALTRLLRGLGVAADAVPIEVDQAAALYRSMLAGKRMLVVLDNARSAEQVRPLLPGTPGPMVVVTSRARLTGLVATHGIYELNVEVLTRAEAVALLTVILGKERVNAEPDAASELAELCACVPLALRIAAANVVGQSGVPAQPVAAYVSRLRGEERLDELTVAGDPSSAVRTAFDRSYQALDSDTRRLFRLLGLVPGQHVSVAAAGALAALSPERARRLLERLASAHLVEPRTAGRFGFHDLLRRYAHERALETDGERARAQAMERLLVWYLHTTDAAARRLYPGKLRLPVAPAEGVSPLGFADQAEALAWLDAERANLVSAVGHAAEHGPRTLAWLLADVSRAYFTYNRHMVDWLTVARAALAAAQAVGNAQAEAAAQRNLGRVHQALGDYGQAAALYTSALERARRSRWVEGEAAVLVAIGMTDRDRGQLRQAADHHARALTLYRKAGSKGGQAIAIGNLGDVSREMGCLEQAADHAANALSLYQEVTSKGGLVVALTTLAQVDRDRGRLQEARQHLLRVMALTREIGNRYGEARGLCVLATVHRDAGGHTQAWEAAQDALEMARHIRDPRVQADALNTLGSIRSCQDDGQEASELHRQALDLARRTNACAPQIDAVLGLAAAQTLLGEHSRAILHARQALGLAQRAGYRISQAQAHIALAAAFLALDHDVQAAEHARQALDLHNRIGHRLGRCRALVALSRALMATDDSNGAWALTLLTDVGSRDAGHLSAMLHAVPVPPALAPPARAGV
jgi:tetratricopeptide (TPR) repeat protein/transcriptional regulator with XRE-family HTH domain